MTSLSIQSNENLEITVTKAGLTLLTDLGQVRALKVSFFEIIFLPGVFYPMLYFINWAMAPGEN